MSDIQSNNEIKKEQKPSKKRRMHPFRILVLVVVFCAVVFGTIVVSDFFFSKNDSTSREPEIVAITVSGKSIILNDDDKVTLEGLREYLDTMEKSGDLFTVALINDTENPADYLVYNSVVDLLAEYEIICEKMEKPASFDETKVSTPDER